MWIVGQRVIAELEPELGLGIIVSVHGARLVEVLFPGAEVARRYSTAAAPLRRLVLAPGQRAKSKRGETFTVKEAREKGGLVLYLGDGVEVWEYELDHIIADTSPLTRFLSGHWGHPREYALREQAWKLRSHSVSPHTKGLVGPRVSLLPHQLYIASEIAGREYPRVLLADEVGLGKTIEAGLIFSALRALGRAERVLILVPDSLKHQWLAELYRRFNEMFAVVDEERSEAEEESQGSSAFRQNQRIICSIDFLMGDPARLEQAVDETWDLLIIDEAHHLEWSADDPSPDWEVAKLLSARARGLLLLTATPENHGVETEFGLLHLVDPERFPDYASFREGNEKLRTTARLAAKLQAGTRTPAVQKDVEKHFKGDADLKEAALDYLDGAAPDGLLHRLVDRHGTGRVFIRNRRARLKGFPERRFTPHPLEASPEWAKYLQGFPSGKGELEKVLHLAAGHRRLPPGEPGKAWFAARAKWLQGLLKQLGDKKVLLIGSVPKRAEELQAWLRNESSVRTALFHEDLEIVERDRQAAWFQQPGGAQVLLCSEIGSEGRNFQFAHHLVLFDLPLHPDLLEQRIGRLDRIGQTESVHIHVPYVEGTPEEVLLRWYSEGLQSFEEPWNAGDAAGPLLPRLAETCALFLQKSKTAAVRKKALAALIDDTRKAAAEIREKQKESVDVLVDLNSFDEKKGNALAARIRAIDENRELSDLLHGVWNHFGVEVDELDGHGTIKLTAHSLTFVDNFPGLSSRGEVLATFQRPIALAREELHFLTYDSTIAQGALSLVLEGTTGSASAGVWQGDGLHAPIVELLYVLQATAPAPLEVERDLPVEPIAALVTLEGKPAKPPPGWPVGRTSQGAEAAPRTPAGRVDPLPPTAFARWKDTLREALPVAVERAGLAVKKAATERIAVAIESRRHRFHEEHERLTHLARVNPLISRKELETHRQRGEAGVEALKGAEVRLEALRVIFPR